MLCPMARTVTPFLVGVMMATGACSAPPPAGDFSAADTASVIRSIETVVRDRDTSKLRKIVEQLDSDDPAVRLVAISALHTLTGETCGYHYDDPPSFRQPAIERWVAYVNRINPDRTPADG